MKSLAALLVAATLLSSCDCVRDASGIVLDKTTGQPVDSVAIGELGKPHDYLHYYSDSTGRYTYSDISGGLFGCPDLNLVFFKDGYKILRLRFPSATQNDTVYLERERPGL